MATLKENKDSWWICENKGEKKLKNRNGDSQIVERVKKNNEIGDSQYDKRIKERKMWIKN